MSARNIDPMLPQLFQIERIQRETHDTFTLTLNTPKGNAGFRFAPGQFNMLYAYGVGEIPISISGDPAIHTALVHTIRAVGAVTTAMEKLKKGDLIGVRGPFGTGWQVAQAEGNDVLIVAGGIGIAPLRPALYYCLKHREKFGRVMLLYGTRTPEDILFLRELEQWRSRFDLDVHVTVDRGMGKWRGNVGVVTILINKAAIDPTCTTALVCGPEIMMRFTVLELLNRGMAEKDVFLSMERNMKCGIGFCGHCQCGPFFICKDGPVFSYDRIKDLLDKREI
ncbi:MAG: FAD/NAD(P)-binding protein [bacterium]